MDTNVNVSQIHGVPTPPLGYRLAKPTDTCCPGMRYWSPLRKEWQNDDLRICGPFQDAYIYALPLNDGYEYFEAGTTTIQAGDEVNVSGGWIEHDEESYGEKNDDPLRRPKAKPPTYSERQAACGLKVGDRVKVVRRACSYQDGWGDSWTESMDAMLGKVFAIEDMDNNGVGLDDGEVHFSFPYFVLEKVSRLAPGRNINGLTCDQVGVSEGWRLITEGELESPPCDCQYNSTWNSQVTWSDRAVQCPIRDYNLKTYDYRTKAPLPVEESPEIRHSYRICGMYFNLTVSQSEAITALAQAAHRSNL